MNTSVLTVKRRCCVHAVNRRKVDPWGRRYYLYQYLRSRVVERCRFVARSSRDNIASMTCAGTTFGAL